MPARETCVLRHALEHHARERPAAVFAVFEDGERWTFAGTLADVRAVAAGLQALGVRRGDSVVLMLPNGAVSVRLLFAINYLGAVFVPINPAYRGGLLSHVVADSGAALAIVRREALGRLLEAEAPALRTVVVADGEANGDGSAGLRILDASALWGDPAALPPLDRPIEPWDPQSILYTSGTTGRSKGVLSSYRHSFASVGPEGWSCLRTDDRQLLHMPVFHIGGAFIACVALCVGSSIAVVEGFRTDAFWPTVRALEVTSVFLLGAMATFLLKAPQRPDDRDHPLRMVFIVPLGRSGPAFRERFGVDVYTLFNMTEISTPLISGPNPEKPNICGRPRRGIDLRLVDENDCPVPEGAAGELILRTDGPWAMNSGYHNNAEATAAAWRNGWFHTGDLFRRDPDGDYAFVDRRKDVIRRRGENISSYEVEVELLSHSDVREAAAVPVPSEFTEDEVLAVVSAVPGRTLDPAGLCDHLAARLPPFMVPRFVRIVDDLPKTPTAKVEKHRLRAAGVTPDTWERHSTTRERG